MVFLSLLLLPRAQIQESENNDMFLARVTAMLSQSWSLDATVEKEAFASSPYDALPPVP